MATIKITDLDQDETLDANAMKTVRGGGLSDWIGDAQWAFYEWMYNDSITGTSAVIPMQK